MSLRVLTCSGADCSGNPHCLRSPFPDIIGLGGDLGEDIRARRAADTHSEGRAVGSHPLFHLGRRLDDTAVHSQVRGISAAEGTTIDEDGNLDSLTLRRIVAIGADRADTAGILASLVASPVQAGCSSVYLQGCLAYSLAAAATATSAQTAISRHLRSDAGRHLFASTMTFLLLFAPPDFAVVHYCLHSSGSGTSW